ncbi:MAG: hypothetical protein JXR81_06810 [Candidatus Goldbacteria bacterium]|nr:hypothetical protein [Candidatus Goldiibacteriota bacterium]
MGFYRTQAEIRKDKNHPKSLSEERLEDVEERLTGLNMFQQKWKYGLEYIRDAMDRMKKVDRK